jgi:hypothetical protein
MKRTVFLTAVLLLTFLCHAQEPQFLTVESGGQSYELPQVLAPPQSGTFFFLQLTNLPPLPYNPYFDSGLDVYAWGNVFLVDDSAVDYVSLRQELRSMQMMSLDDGPPLPGGEPGGGGSGGEVTNAPPAFLTSTNLCLLPPVFLSSNSLSLTGTNAEPNGIYDLFNTTNLAPDVPGLNLTNWLWLVRGAVGQTNFVLTDISMTQMQSYYLLGTMQDSDSDGLTDAYEKLVSHTDLNNPDTDGDGLSDYYELLNGLSPFALQAIPSLSFISVPQCPIP